MNLVGDKGKGESVWLAFFLYDVLTQFAILAKQGDDSALVTLCEIGIIELFDPPFDKSDLNPGYVKGYVPGVRENGGQYTHAAP